MSDSLYQDAIIAHARSGIGESRLEAPTASITVDNPLCGDRVTLDLALADGVVTAVGHAVRGCLLCRASAAVLAGAAVSQTPPALRAAAQAFARMIREDGPVPQAMPALEAFTPVRATRSRHECVLLPFTALSRALAAAEAGAESGADAGF